MQKFDFYLLNLSFRCPEGLTLSDLQSKIQHFVEDHRYIKKQPNEQIYSHYSIYDEVLWKDFTISDILNYSKKGKEAIGDRYFDFLQEIIHKTKKNNT